MSTDYYVKMLKHFSVHEIINFHWHKNIMKKLTHAV